MSSNRKAATKRGVNVKSGVKAGFGMTVSKASPSLNHNQAVKGPRVKSGVKAGRITLTDILVSG